MKTRHLRAVTLLLVPLVACAEREPLPVSGSLEVSTHAATSEDIERVADLLTKRLTKFLPSRSSTVTPAITGAVITFTFRGEAPPEEQVRYLATTRGELLFQPADDPTVVWASDMDIEDAALTSTEHGPFLSLRLNEKAGRALLNATAANIGREMLVTWDGEPIVSAPIRGAFAESFQFNAPSANEGLMMRVILQTGRLPVPVVSAEYRHGT